MNLPRLRCTIRRMMITLAIVTVPFGVMVERQQRFWRIAAYHKQEFVEMVESNHESGSADDPIARRACWHEAMWGRYDTAAWCPWMPLAPDPPEPPAADAD